MALWCVYLACLSNASIWAAVCWINYTSKSPSCACNELKEQQFIMYMSSCSHHVLALHQYSLVGFCVVCHCVSLCVRWKIVTGPCMGHKLHSHYTWYVVEHFLYFGFTRNKSRIRNGQLMDCFEGSGIIALGSVTSLWLQLKFVSQRNLLNTLH